MKLLLLGGGVFLGRALVDAALGAGHDLTVFNRGQRRSDWPAAVEVLRGDRLRDLDRLAGRNWDAVIDTCGYLPGEVAASAQALAHCGQYLFVSSVSALAPLTQAGAGDDAPLADATGVPADSRAPAHYGAQKAACERALAHTLAEHRRRSGHAARAVTVRPGLIVGPGDPTGRFSHWPWRMAEGGLIPVPDAPGAALQVIDVRDLASGLLAVLQSPADGPFNMTGPVVRWADLIAACALAAQDVGRQPATAVPVDEAQLLAAGVQPWQGLPLWIPASEPISAGFMAVNADRARAAGLRTRPLRETARDILRDDPAPPSDPRRAERLQGPAEAACVRLAHKPPSTRMTPPRGSQ